MNKLLCCAFFALFTVINVRSVLGCDQSSGCPVPTPACDKPDVCPTPPPVTCVLTAEPSELWPPNHKFVPITFFDSEGNVVTPIVTGVFQDEPTLVIGSGNFCPDAIIGNYGSVWVRSERTGAPGVPGDGRVYHIQFTLETDSGLCSGEVTVCVPHDQSPNNACIDQGPLYDSLECSTDSIGVTSSTGSKAGKSKATSGKSKKKAAGKKFKKH